MFYHSTATFTCICLKSYIVYWQVASKSSCPAVCPSFVSSTNLTVYIQIYLTCFKMDGVIKPHYPSAINSLKLILQVVILNSCNPFSFLLKRIPCYFPSEQKQKYLHSVHGEEVRKDWRWSETPDIYYEMRWDIVMLCCYVTLHYVMLHWGWIV